MNLAASAVQGLYATRVTKVRLNKYIQFNFYVFQTQTRNGKNIFSGNRTHLYFTDFYFNYI